MIKHIATLLLFLPVFAISQKSVYERTAPKADDHSPVSLISDTSPTLLWMYPSDHLKGEQFERIELGIELPLDIHQKVIYFLGTDDSTKGINPFLEWQLDIDAQFTHTTSGTVKNADGFYFADFSRDTSNADFRKWKWVQEETPTYMRVRFAPPEPGTWQCQVAVKTRDTSFTFSPFTFEVLRSNNPGYVKVGDSKRYFTLGNETFFPSGQNLVSPRCEFCFTNGHMDLPDENNPAAQSLESWMLKPTVMKGFIMFQDHMRSLAANGGNYFRELLIPQNQGLEWEKLGNYYGRMNRAWEIDEQVFLAEELGLWIQLNLQIQFALEADDNRIFWNWSADPQDRRHYSKNTPCANPYNLQIKSTKNDDPNTFFSDPTARKFYKQKLRYIVARWGYSTKMAVFGMASEIETSCTDSPVCVAWMEEMGKYLKKDLAINQLLTPSFLGIYHDPENYENRIIAMDEYDMSTLNWYSASPTKFEYVAQTIDNFNETFQKPFFYGEMGNADLYNCDTARIEWIRDAWFSALSGNAGVGLNWDDPFDDELRQHLGYIHDFMGGIDFDNNGDAWQSRRVLSDNRKVETLFLVSPDQSYAVGLISNRYYNWYHTRNMSAESDQNSPCYQRKPIDPGFYPELPPAKKGVWERTYEERPTNYIDRVRNNSQMNDSVSFTTFESISHESGPNYRIRLYDFQRGSYTLEFYNTLTMEYLGSSTNWGPSIRIEYPEMTMESGLIAFKLKLNRADDYPQIQDADRVLIDYNNIQLEETDKRFAVSNNLYQLYLDKTTQRLAITIKASNDRKDYAVKIYNSADELVYNSAFNKDEQLLKLKNLALGAYRIDLSINKVIYTEHFELR